ncbi:MAG: FHA domain-containing protein [Microcoleaceae cyanobacterium]
MIVCPNCSHQNPEGAVQCEACYTPLPTTTTCPNCGATVQSDAAFCGQCGFGLQPSPAEAEPITAAVPPELMPQAVQEPLMPEEPGSLSLPATVAEITIDPLTAPPASEQSLTEPPIVGTHASTQLQQSNASLVHVQTDTVVELPQNLSVIHIGKPNQLIPPDIDVSGFSNAEVVSRVHADIRVEAEAYYIEDTGSSNGTYINNIPLHKGNRHRLRPGDRISLGKGDLVSFIFQQS